MSRTNGHIAKFVCLPGQRDGALEVLRPMFAQVQAEPGAILYLMHLCRKDPDVIWFYERYVDDAAFEFHSSSPAHDVALSSLLKLLDPSWKLYWVDLVFGKGLGTADTKLGANSDGDTYEVAEPR
jgi:quinol monooxygenase YgiN